MKNSLIGKSLIGTAARLVLLICLAGSATAWAGASDAWWHDDAGRIPSADAPHPAEYRSLTLDTAAMKGYLREARESGVATPVTLPHPDGGLVEFLIVDSGTMPAALQHKYPGILSFKGSDANGRSLRLDVSVMGFQAMVFDPAGIWVVRPEVLGGGDRYLSFERAELAVPHGMGECQVHDTDIDPAGLDLVPPEPTTQTGVTHRVYRTAVAANHHYIEAVGGSTVEGGLAATVVAVNRVTEVYESEMSIQLTLVPNNDLIMYPNAAGDPFGSNDGSVIGIATGIINAAIGSSNYDIGHVFTTGSGGVAGLRVVCGSSKARGTTGLGNPIGDVFYIDYVAHEMGHQFGGNHPFNGTRGSCAGGNRHGKTAYEPGSGSTIMAYAGICAADDLQPNSDPFFHAISLQEITNFTSSGSGDCSVNTPNANQVPVIDTASLPTGYTIPARTPFVLSGSATDADGDALTYSWEEWDLGPANPLTGGDIGSGPIFRAFAPVPSGARMFPKLSTVLTGVPVPGEVLPTTTRDLKFRLTVRDGVAGHGTSISADILVEVDGSAGPFAVTAPNTAVVWNPGSTQTVTWNVADTDEAPVDCAAVDIALSGDGGQTFASTLATGVPNDGSATITVPAIATTGARVSVSCADNLFFDVSDVDFEIPVAADTFTVGGTVGGLEGSGLALKLNGGANLPIAGNGPFTFPTALPDATNYSVIVAVQPDGPMQECVVSNGDGTIGGADVTDVEVECTTIPPPMYSVGGSVSGLQGSGLELSLNGGANLPIAGNGPFTFPTSLPDAASYSVTVAIQPGDPDQECTVSNGDGTVNGADVTDVQVDCMTLPPPTYSVGGDVDGLEGSGLALRLNDGANLPVAGDGPFTFPAPLADGTVYSVTVAVQPDSPMQECVVSNGDGTINGADVTDVEVECTTLPPPTYSVGGSVAGLVGSGLALSLNGGANLAIAGDGPFTFPLTLVDGSDYAVVVAVQPDGPEQVCSVANGDGTIDGADVTDIDVTCVIAPPDTFVIGGTVSGLSGSGLILILNGTDDLPVSGNGEFAFPTGLPDGSAYSVTVDTQPAIPAQTCIIANGAGTVVDADVDDIAVTCTNDPTDVIFADGFDDADGNRSLVPG